jgi:hypothetical protein
MPNVNEDGDKFTSNEVSVTLLSWLFSELNPKKPKVASRANRFETM